ncbi:MAG: DUF2085 domain-containing protein [Pyrinomonadaceae bacterium]
MTEPVENYTPQAARLQLKRHDRVIWLAALAATALWIAAILTAPIAKAAEFQQISGPVYGFFGFICHQIEARSFHISGHHLAVCSRCFGVYIGLLAGFAIYPIWRGLHNIEPLPRFWLILAVFPMAIDFSLTLFGIWENTHASRFITGAVLGFACATFIVPALIEIVRGLTDKHHFGR